MLTLPPSVRIYVATSPVDARKSFDGLSTIIHKGTFRVPSPLEPGAPSIEMTDSELEVLLDAVNLDASPKREKKPRLH